MASEHNDVASKDPRHFKSRRHLGLMQHLTNLEHTFNFEIYNYMYTIFNMRNVVDFDVMITVYT